MEEYKIPKIHKTDYDITVESDAVFSYHTHMHSYYEMTLYEPFQGYVMVNDKVFIMDEPSAVLVVPSDFHRIEVTGKQSAKYIKIAFEAGSFDEKHIPDSSLVLRGIGKEDFSFRLFQEIEKTEKQTAYRKQLVHTAMFLLSERGEKVLPSENDRGCRLAKKAVRIINEKFSEDITLSSVAEELFVSPQYLSCVFKANIGINFSKFLSGIRLRRASKFLIETKESITHICELCGYRNFSHFLRCFKRTFGISPSVYRARNNQINK